MPVGAGRGRTPPITAAKCKRVRVSTAALESESVALIGRLPAGGRGVSVQDEAFLYKREIDRPTYERQRDKLREDIALVRIELEDAKLDEIDLEGC